MTCVILVCVYWLSCVLYPLHIQGKVIFTLTVYATIPLEHMQAKPTNAPIFIKFINYVW
jgi:hypothetical protein